MWVANTLEISNHKKGGGERKRETPQRHATEFVYLKMVLPWVKTADFKEI